mmetsp:Transcript_135537/g.234522  ORF Transcript_135537/g.234522 Transcript_135537/m.234522 type:complete len:121 (-) Transcript_135537:275-637(-)
MVPIVVVWHLCEREPALRLVCQIQVTADARMLLQAFENSEDVRKPECAMVEWKQNLRTEMSTDVIDQVFKPVVLICVAREWMPGPVVDRVQVLPEEWVDVVCPVSPVHAKGHDVMVTSQL